ncbi:hypothetical protein A2U01_0030823, partial [Trifolium medium]|nr:hypothetical protein [Trifolium medium]
MSIVLDGIAIPDALRSSVLTVVTVVYAGFDALMVD